MADSFLRFNIERGWVDVNTLLRIPIGMKFELQITGGSNADAAISLIEPAGNIGEILKVKFIYGVSSGQDKFWLRTSDAFGASSVAVRINGPFDPAGDYAPEDYSTDYSQDI